MWKKIKRALLIVLALLVVGVAGLFGYVQATYQRDFSSTPLPDIKASTDPEVIARGAYLANAVAHCSGCHGNIALMKDRKLPPDLRDLRGGLEMKAGPFGTFYPSNITPDPMTGIGKMSDAQVARVIRHGVSPTGRLDAFMSFAVGPMADEDLTALVSYLRSIPPVTSATKDDEWGIIAKALAGSFNPNMATAPTYVPPGAASVERGAYLANGPAVCFGCHSPFDPTKGFAPSGPRFSGEAEATPDDTEEGFEIIGPNLTPDPETGVISAYTEETFIERFRKGRVYLGSKMPWENFALMNDDDLRSILRYLKTLPPTKNDIGPGRRKSG